MVRERGGVSAEATGSARVNAARGLLATLLLAAAASFLLVALLVDQRWAPLLRLDIAVRDGLHGFARDHDGFVSLMRALSWLGSTWAWFVVVTVLALVLLRARQARLAAVVIVTVAGSSLLNSTVKALVGRTRPVFTDPLAQAGGWSFPSGHAQAAVVGYAVLALLLVGLLPAAWRGRRALAGAAAVLMTLAIGFSRIALGVHFLSDVVAGYLLGVAWVLILLTVVPALFPALTVLPARSPALRRRPGPGR